MSVRWLVLLAVSAMGTVARADELGVLAVADPPAGPDAALAALAGRLGAALAAEAEGVLPPDALRARMEGRAPPVRLPELDRAYAGALAAQEAGEFEESNRMLRARAAALEAQPEGPEVFAAWTRAMARLARSEQELGRGAEAQVVLERLLRAAPDLRPDARQYPPSYQKLVEEARARLRGLGAHELTVEAGPEVRVFVEGRDVGLAPVALSLAPGRYRVTGLRGGMGAAAQVVELDGDRTVQLDLSLADALRPDAGPGVALPAGDRARRLAMLGARLGLDRLVTVELVEEAGARALAAALLDLGRGVVEREGRVALAADTPAEGALEALARHLGTGAPSPLVLAGRVARPLPLDLAFPGAAPTGHEPRGRGAGLIWAAAGAGLATLAVGTLTAIHARDAQARYDEARRLLGPDGRIRPGATVADYNALVLRGDDRRASAQVLGFTSGVALLTTGVLSYLAYRQSGEVGAFRF